MGRFCPVLSPEVTRPPWPLSSNSCTEPETPPGWLLIICMTAGARGLELLDSMLASSLPAISSRKLTKPPRIKTWGARLKHGAREPRPNQMPNKKSVRSRSSGVTNPALFLLSDNLLFDLGVSGCGNDLLAGQVGFLRVGTAVNDLLRIFLPDAGQSVQLVLGRRIDVEQFGCRRGGHGGVRLGGFGTLSGCALCRGHAAEQDQSEN